MSNTVLGGRSIRFGGARRPYFLGTLSTAIFCELQREGFDLEDYNKLFLEIGVNQLTAEESRAKGEAFEPQGRKALTPLENSQFIYSALYAGAKREGLMIDFDVDKVGDWMDAAEASQDTELQGEAGKVFATHYALMVQRAQRLVARPGYTPPPKDQPTQVADSKKDPLTWARTLSEAIAVVGILPDVFWGLSWADYDDLVFHYYYQEQKDLRGHREIATRIYNSLGAFSQSFSPLAAKDYWALPLLDSQQVKEVKEQSAADLERLKNWKNELEAKNMRLLAERRAAAGLAEDAPLSLL